MADSTRELIKLHFRELFRDRKYFWFALLFPYFMFGTFVLINSLIPKDSGEDFISKLIIPMAIYLAVTSIAFSITSGPIASMRSKGLFRLLSTTPLSRTRLIFTHSATRLLMATVQVFVLLLLGVVLKLVDFAYAPRLFALSLLGLFLFLPIGYILGGRLNSPDLATNIGTLIQLLTFFVSGLAFPMALIPESFSRILHFLPSTVFAELLSSSLFDQTPYFSAGFSVFIIIGSGLAFIILAITSFRWEQTDSRR
ncbi:ABC-type polysaccharide/polyol phosphate export systems, permease component [Corynebacterium mustelae]|uniref:ABC-type polysaccharide/polyol phosphate export systems, permease component n=1 Tax=Corynebacterium mustelae TaxID=571915 RepID=A0A0G3GYR2_9CORY|nr:ABC transporter permease [Corynebacterium mustelae]AKK04668.1 ABC-type polysaccharide/polyol phosphate export systems, permease component [Corynebacterium mustelae]